MGALPSTSTPAPVAPGGGVGVEGHACRTPQAWAYGRGAWLSLAAQLPPPTPSLLCRPFLPSSRSHALLSRPLSAPPGHLSSRCPAGATPLPAAGSPLHSLRGPPTALLGALSLPLPPAPLSSFRLSGALWVDPAPPTGQLLLPLLSPGLCPFLLFLLPLSPKKL